MRQAADLVPERADHTDDIAPVHDQIEVVVDGAITDARDQSTHLDGRGFPVQRCFIDFRHRSSSM